MQRCGRIQRDILAVLARAPITGAFIGSTTKAPELRGYDWEQVERSLGRLLMRSIVKRRGILYLLASRERSEVMKWHPEQSRFWIR